MIKKVLALVAMSAAIASAHASVLLTEGFNAAPANWTLTNASTPAGTTGWFQANDGIFAAHSGGPIGYYAASYTSAAEHGTIANWLISPVFSTEFAVSVSLWMRADQLAGYFDSAAFGFSTGSDATASFVMGNTFVVGTNGWGLYTATLAAQGAGSTGRFAIEYVGAQDSANYLGVDDLSIETIPEPASLFIMGAGAFGLVAARRRRQPA